MAAAARGRGLLHPSLGSAEQLLHSAPLTPSHSPSLPRELVSQRPKPELPAPPSSLCFLAPDAVRLSSPAARNQGWRAVPPASRAVLGLPQVLLVSRLSIQELGHVGMRKRKLGANSHVLTAGCAPLSRSGRCPRSSVSSSAYQTASQQSLLGALIVRDVFGRPFNCHFAFSSLPSCLLSP